MARTSFTTGLAWRAIKYLVLFAGALALYYATVGILSSADAHDWRYQRPATVITVPPCYNCHPHGVVVPGFAFGSHGTVQRRTRAKVEFYHRRVHVREHTRTFFRFHQHHHGQGGGPLSW